MTTPTARERALREAYAAALPVLRRVFDGASWFPSGWMSLGRKVTTTAGIGGLLASRDEHAAIARLVWSVESDDWAATPNIEDTPEPRCNALGPTPPLHCQRELGHTGNHACEVGATGNWTLKEWPIEDTRNAGTTLDLHPEEPR